MSLFGEGPLYQLLGQQALCILKCAVSIGQYTHTVCKRVVFLEAHFGNFIQAMFCIPLVLNYNSFKKII